MLNEEQEQERRRNIGKGGKEEAMTRAVGAGGPKGQYVFIIYTRLQFGFSNGSLNLIGGWVRTSATATAPFIRLGK